MHAPSPIVLGVRGVLGKTQVPHRKDRKNPRDKVFIQSFRFR